MLASIAAPRTEADYLSSELTTELFLGTASPQFQASFQAQTMLQ